MHGANTLDMSLYDYQAALHHWSAAHKSPEDEAADEFTPDELNNFFSRLVERGVGSFH